jgi:sugar O-acyltransferase (sialic acid O-acetyltransferase NeuD family)
MINVLIYGSGPIAREIYGYHTMGHQLDDKVQFNFIGYISDIGRDLEFERSTNLAFYGGFDHLENKNACQYLIAIGDPIKRAMVAKKIELSGQKLFSYMHPSALISNSANIKDGCIFYPFVVVSANTEVGKCVIINSYSGVGHDVRIGDFTTISAQVDLAGFVSVGFECFFGSGARVVPGKRIGNQSSIGAGVTVIKNIKDRQIVLPLPNKVMNSHHEF